MATLSFSPKYGDWQASINIPYTTSYNRDTNQTTVTFTSANVSYYGRQGYGTRMDCTIKVTATDSSNNKSTTLTTYGYTSGGSVSTFYGTPSPGSVTVSHSGTGTKQVKIQASCTIYVYMYSSDEYQTEVSGSGSTTVTVGSRFVLSINQGSGSTISVTRSGTALSNGDIISSGEYLVISFATATGYYLTSHKVNNSDFTSGNTHSVSSNVTVVSTAAVISYSLTISQGNNTSISVNRTESPYGGGAQGYLNNGATLYYGDKLSMSYAVDTGYTIETHTINGESFDSGTVYIVYQAVTVATTSTLNTYAVSTSIGEHMDLLIMRTASPLGGGETGKINNTGATVFHGDVLVITALPSSGYGTELMTVNNSSVSSPHTITVVSSLSIVVIAAALGFVHIDSGASIEKYKIVIDSGSSMEQYRAMIDTGSQIVPY